jgi:hypothetical protein
MWRLSGSVLYLAASHAFACTAAPANWSDDPYSMVIDTQTIVLAKATRVDRDGKWTTARFETIESLRGTPPESFSLRGWFQAERVYDFSGHRDPGFWVSNVDGSAVAPGDCNAYGVFESGQNFLIFLDGPVHPRSFENVRSSEDLWYQTVSAAVARLTMVLEAK